MKTFVTRSLQPGRKQATAATKTSSGLLNKNLGRLSFSTMPVTAGKTKERAYNFSAGPACIDTEIMYDAESQFTNWNGTGMGIIEMSHRDAGGTVQQCIEETSDLIRELLNVPNNYDIFFMHGGAHAQFAAIPLNLGKTKNATNNNLSSISAGYVISGYWSQRAMDEARKFVNAKEIANAQISDNYNSIPSTDEWNYDEDMSYIHICGNETIHGLEYLTDPQLPPNAPPLVADFTSTLFSRPVDISKYGVIYASAGKNFGPPGVCIVIARKDLIQEPSKRSISECPGILDYYEMSYHRPTHSIWNTPPVFQIYMANLTFKKYKNMCLSGGKVDMNIIGNWTNKRVQKIYDIIDRSDGFYLNTVKPEYRSHMNVPFRVTNKDKQVDTNLERKFTQIAEIEYNLLQLFGHPVFGGQRITCYNPVPDAAIDKCAEFMQEFMESQWKLM